MHRWDGEAAYDPNGNMVLRVEDGVTYQQEFDAENRLAVVTNTVTGEVTRFVYDGNGNRLLRIGPDGTTVYIGDYYEQTGSAIRKYYYAGGQRIAVRVDGALYFLHSDHLGSATLATDVSGNRVGEARYKPYGEVRYSWGVMPTDRLYTGQRWDSALGLYDYRSRYYDPALGRFISADPVVPNPGNPKALNRYAYVLNNPIRYNDPTGHAYECGVYAGTSCADVGPKFPVEIIQAPPDALDNVWAVTEFVGAVVSEPVDWVLTARDFLGGQGSPWALVGLLPLVPSSVGKYADEAADALRGAGRAEEAGESIGRTIHHHIATNKNWIREPRWSERFQKLFAKGGMSLDDAANIVELPAELHKGPHSQAYHQWVYRRLREAIAGLDNPAQIRSALEARLRWIAEQLKAHPEWLRNPPIQGGR